MVTVRPEYFERELKVALQGSFEEMNAELAAFAKSELHRVISEGIASPIYDRYVNGVMGAPEESVRIPNGILYTFSNWPLVINAALEELRKRVPRKTGRYASSFTVLVNERPVTDFGTIPANAEVIIFNPQPYTRKMESGGNGPGKRHFDLAELAVNRRFGDAFRAQTTYLNMSGGVVPGVPYILKGEYSRLRRARLANPARFSRSFPKRKDMEPGQPITYPAMIINVL
jgi:hypothetical protein